MSEFYTSKEVARICRVEVITVRQWLREGKLRGVKVGRSYLIPRDSLREYLGEKHG